LFDSNVQHPIVPWRGGDGDSTAGNAAAGVNRAEAGTQQTGAALRFVDGGDTGGGKAVDNGCICPFDNLNYNSGHN
jgi:hypothetical protein